MKTEEQLVAVVDGARARYFAVGSRAAPGGTERRQLLEVETLVNEARLPQAREPAATADDGGDAHSEEHDRRFAKLAARKLAELIRARDARYAILAAGPRMLGHLRDHRDVLPPAEIGELPKHLTELSAHELCLRLEAEELI